MTLLWLAKEAQNGKTYEYKMNFSKFDLRQNITKLFYEGFRKLINKTLLINILLMKELLLFQYLYMQK